MTATVIYHPRLADACDRIIAAERAQAIADCKRIIDDPRGYASAWLRETPHTHRMRVSAKAHEDRALKQGNIAVWSILRDWIKGQIMAVECDVLKFDAAFLGQILLPDGRTIHQHVEDKGMLPQIGGPK